MPRRRPVVYAAALGGLRTGQHDGNNQGGRGEEANHGSREQRVEADDGQQSRGDHRADDAFEIVCQSRKREGAGVVAFFRKDIGDGGLEGGGERRRCRLQHEDQNVDLPDLVDEGQSQRHGGPDEVERDQHAPSRKTFGEAAAIGDTPT